MDRPLTEVQTFIKETQRQIDEDGLTAMSGTNFKRGDPIRRVLKAKQYEHRMYTSGVHDMFNRRCGKFVSVAQIAKSLNGILSAIQNGETTPLVFEDDIETYIDDMPRMDVSESLAGKSFKFDDSQKKDKSKTQLDQILQLEKDGKTKPYYDY